MGDHENLPDFYTQREVDKTRRRQRMVGRLEGAAAVVVGGMILNFIGWIPTVLVIAVVGYVLYRIVKPKKGDEDL